MTNLKRIAIIVLFGLLGLLVASYWILMIDNNSLQRQINDLTTGLDRSIMDVSTVTNIAIASQGDITAMKKRIDKLNSMLYNADSKIERLQDKIECQQSQIVILRKEFK